MTELDWQPAAGLPDLLALPVRSAIGSAGDVKVAPIDATLADTAAFCAEYEVPLSASANCVVVLGRRAGQETYAAVMVLAGCRRTGRCWWTARSRRPGRS